MKKLLLISNMYPSKNYPYYGTFVENFEKGLQQHGVIVDRIVITKRKHIICKLAAYLLFSIKVVFTCNFRGDHYFAIYVHYINHTLLPFLFVRKGRLPVLILNSHGSDIIYEHKRAQLIASITSKVIPHATKIVVPSIYFKEELLKKTNFPSDDIFISPSGGLDLKSLEQKKDIINREIINIGYLGRIDHNKGWDTFVKAMSLLKRKKTKFKIHIAGDGKESQELDRMISEYDLTNETERVGFIEHKKVSSFFQDIDLFVFPSKRKGESLGLVALEALACGVPVIANNNGAVKDYVIENRNGFVYNQDNEFELFEKINQYISLPLEEKINMSKFACQSIQKYDSNIIAKEMFDFIYQMSSYYRSCLKFPQ